MSNLTPKEIVEHLDKHVIGQEYAKKVVAIALRNRWRRKQVSDDIKDEIYPHNILMIGPTGVGKTEIARRLAKMTNSPFIKVEATKFTEVGYVGRDVESVVRDLLDIAINLVRESMRKHVEQEANFAAEARVIEALVGDDANDETKKKFYEKFKKGELDDKQIEISLQEGQPKGGSFPMFDMPGAQMGVLNVTDIIGKAMGGSKSKPYKMTVQEGFERALKEECDKLLDEDKITQEALRAVEEDGIIFLDEIDKIAARSQVRGEVNREGVQRDLLPLIEGTTVNTKYGPVKTDHILFIGSGAFHLAKPSDLLPELQGRLPIRVELSPLTEEDLIRILKEPKHSLLKQYEALFKVEDVEVEFADSGIKKLASIATMINTNIENTGARRLHTILAKLLESLNFTASETPGAKVKVDKKYVENNLSEIDKKKQDLEKFIL